MIEINERNQGQPESRHRPRRIRKAAEDKAGSAILLNVTPSVARPQVVACRRFAYFLDDVARPPRAAMAAHLRYLATLETRDLLVIAGRFRDGGDGVVCVLADDEFEADAIARADPLVAFGYTLYRLREILDVT